MKVLDAREPPDVSILAGSSEEETLLVCAKVLFKDSRLVSRSDWTTLFYYTERPPSDLLASLPWTK